MLSSKTYYLMLEDLHRINKMPLKELSLLPYNAVLQMYYHIFGIDTAMDCSTQTAQSMMADICKFDKRRRPFLNTLTKPQLVERLYVTYIKEDIYQVDMTKSDNLMTDDLLDLYNFALSNGDDEYAQTLRNRLYRNNEMAV